MARVHELAIGADLDNLKRVRSFVESTGEALGIAPAVLGDLCLVVDEAVTNIIIHGYDGADGFVNVLMNCDNDAVIITIRDSAKPFNAELVATPDLDASLAERKLGGLGVFLIRKMTDEAEFRSLPGGGNELRMVKRGVMKGKNREG
jgi:anti-sigma regulatory factor (Ser/Thr protein kinase)